MATVKVSTAQVGDANLSVSSEFEYDIPATIEEAQSRYPARLENGERVDPVYELFKGQFVVALQAPARKEIIAQWESLPLDTREALIQEPEGGEGIRTAKLPPEQQQALQFRMNNWQLGERVPRIRMPAPQEALKYFIDNNKDLSEDKKAEILTQLTALLGVSPAAGRVRAGR